MAVFSVATITAKGLALIAKGQTGTEITFTRMQIGSGQLSGQDPEQLTALIDPISYFALNSMSRNDSSAQVRGIFENSALTVPTYVCELGLFADDPDDGEILYAYSNAGAQGDNIPAFASGPYSKMYKLNVAIGNAEDVTVEVPQGAYIPEADKGVPGGVAPLDSGGVVPEANIPNIPVAKIPSGIDAAKIGEGSVSNAEFQALDGVTGPIQTQLNSKASTSDYVRQPGYGTTAGSANAYTLALSPALTAYVAGVCVAVNIHAANTGASTININGLGARSILDSKGAALTSGKLRAGSVYTLRYNGTAFILQGEGGEYGTAGAAQVLSPYTIGTENGLVAGTMPNRAGDTAALASSIAGTTLKLRASAGYRDGVDDNVTITDPNFIAANILSGKSIFGLSGAMNPRLYASGSVMSSNAGVSKPFYDDNNTLQNRPYVTVSGLTFKPKMIVLWGSGDVVVYVEGSNFTTGSYACPVITIANTGSIFRIQEVPDVSVTSTGFTLPTTRWQILHNWAAFG